MDHIKTVVQLEGPTLVNHMVFSQVEGTLSSMILQAFPASPDKFFNEALLSEKVCVYRKMDTDSLCVSGTLDDLVAYRRKILTLLFPSLPPASQGSGPSSDTGYTEGKGTGYNNVAVQCDLGPSGEGSDRQVSRKGSKDLTEDDEEEALEEEVPPTLSKRGRTIKRPSKFKKMLILRMNSEDSRVEEPESKLLVGGIRKNRKRNIIVQRNFLNKRRKTSQRNLEKISVEEVRRLVEEEKAKKMRDNPADLLEESENIRIENEDPAQDTELMSSDLHILDIQGVEQKRVIKREYEDKMPFKYFCDLCSFKTKRGSHFENHLKFHKKNPNLTIHQCDQCDFKAVRASVVQMHKKVHETSLLKCIACDRYATNNEKQLAKHMKTHKKKMRSCLPLLACQQCSYQTLSKTELMSHMELHGSGDGTSAQPLFQCSQCSYKTHRKEHLVRHKNNVHSNRRPYLCDLCGASFKRVDALASHKTTHLERHQRKLPFSCTQCKKAFKSQAHLKEHMSVHSTTRSYQCHICGQMFKTRAVQLKHQQSIHFNPRSHKCSTCNKDFNTKYALQRHVRTHDDDLVTREIAEGNLTLAPLGQQYDDVADSKDQGVASEELVDENTSAIQTITIGLENQLQSSDIGEVYIQGLDSGSISIVNFDGQQIFIPPAESGEQVVGEREPVKQYIITQQPDTNWALSTPGTDTGTSSAADIVRHVLIPSSTDAVENLVPNLREVHVQLMDDSGGTMKQVLIPSSSISTGTSATIIEQPGEKQEGAEIIEQVISGESLDTTTMSEYDIKNENGQTLMTLNRYSQST